MFMNSLIDFKNKFNVPQAVNRFYLIGLFIFLSNSIFAQENFEIRKINFSGNQTFSAGELLERMALYGTSSFKKKFFSKDPSLFSVEILDSDIERLIRFYQREGFLKAAIQKTNPDIDREKKTIIINIKIIEGEPICVRNVQTNISSKTSVEKDKIQSILKSVLPSLQLDKGKRFRDKLIQSDLVFLSKKFSDTGYPYVQLNYDLNVDQADNKVDLTWNIKSGPECVLGDVEITGNKYVNLTPIRKQLAFKPDDLYQKYLLDKSQQQIYGLGTFHVVTVTALLNENKNKRIPVKIQVREAPRFSTKFGFGYGKEDKFRTFSEFQQLSFLGGARRANLYLKHSGLEPYHVNLKVTQPAFLTPKTTASINPFIRKQKEPGYKVSRMGGSISVLHPIVRHLTSSATYTFERVDLDTNSIALQSISNNENIDLYNKSSITLGLTRDSSNPMFTPTNGMFSAVTFKISGLGLKSDFHYTKFILDLRRYDQIGKTVFAYRLKFGGIKSRDQIAFIPIEDRFFSGGSMSVRGWTRARLGPISEKNIPIGGSSLIESSVELRYPIMGALSGVFFSDFGNVWLDSYHYDFNDLRYSAGFGFRFATPIGPIRFDMARPVADDENNWQFHISIGQAF
jgi:outer membrane protein insertion porin family